MRHSLVPGGRRVLYTGAATGGPTGCSGECGSSHGPGLLCEDVPTGYEKPSKYSCSLNEPFNPKWAVNMYTRLQTVWSLPGPSRQSNKGHSPRCHRRPNGPGRLADKVVQPTTQSAEGCTFVVVFLDVSLQLRCASPVCDAGILKQRYACDRYIH